MKRSFRRIIASVLTVIFIMILLSPLAPLAMWSPSVLAAKVTGECTGDCRTCGCSLERSSTRTCCCWQKKYMLQEEEKSQNSPICCKPQKSMQKKDQKKMVSIKSHCPCERNKLNAIFGSVESPLCTCNTVVVDPVYTEQRMTIQLQQCMKERQADPPDPPPKLIIYS